jgi:hypothetical protein
MIATDENTININPKPSILANKKLFASLHHEHRKPERTLLLGWNWRAAAVINHLDFYTPAKSALTVAAGADDAADIIKEKCSKPKNLKVTFIPGDTTNRRFLDSLKIESYTHVILLCYSDSLDHQQADAKTLITLLHLRDIREKSGKEFSIVSEMLDIRNRNLAEVTKVNDFIVSDKLISLLLAQISEDKRLSSVFQDLFGPTGSEIYIRPVSDYVKIGVPVDFHTVTAAAAAMGETAIGYQPAGGMVVLNPLKTETLTFGVGDRLIVLAEG